MAITQNITALPTAPSSSSPDTFRNDADLFLGSLSTFRTELNTFGTQANSTKTEMDTSATSAALSASSAEASASSAEASANSAQDWAEQSASSANFKGNWSVSNTYLIGDLVYGSDVILYRAMQSSTGINPTGDSTGAYWMKAQSSGVISSPLRYGQIVSSTIPFGSFLRIDLTSTLSILLSYDSANIYAMAYNHINDTVGLPVLLMNGSITYPGVEIIDSTSFVLASASTTNTIKAVACSVSGTVITVGAPVSFTASANVTVPHTGFRLLYKVGTSYLLSYSKATATPSICSLAFTVSGLTITLGSEVVLDSLTGLTGSTMRVDGISSSQALVIYPTTTTLYATPITISGNTITKGTSGTTTTTSQVNCFIFGKVDTGRWIGIIQNTTVKPIMISVSGTTATISVYTGTLSYAIYALSYTSSSSYVIDGNSVLYYNYGGDSAVFRITDNAGTIDAESIAAMSSTSSGCIIVGTNKLVEFVDGSIATYTLENNTVTTSFSKTDSITNISGTPYSTKRNFNVLSTSPIVKGTKQVTSGGPAPCMYVDGIGINSISGKSNITLNTGIGVTDHSYGFSIRQVGTTIYITKVYL